MRARISALLRRWCGPLGCTNWEEYEFVNGKMVAARCPHGWTRF